MPSTSKSQQRLFCMAYAVRKGKIKRSDANKEVLQVADSDMTDQEIKDFMKLKENKLIGLQDYILERLNPRNLGQSYKKVPGDLKIEAVDDDEFELNITGSDWYTCIITPHNCDCLEQKPHLILWSAEAGGFLAAAASKRNIDYILWVDADGFEISADPHTTYMNFQNNVIFSEVIAFCSIYEHDQFDFIQYISDPIDKLLNDFKKTQK